MDPVRGDVIAVILDVGFFPAVAGLLLTQRSLRSERGRIFDYFPKLRDADCSRKGRKRGDF